MARHGLGTRYGFEALAWFRAQKEAVGPRYANGQLGLGLREELGDEIGEDPFEGFGIDRFKDPLRNLQSPATGRPLGP